MSLEMLSILNKVKKKQKTTNTAIKKWHLRKIKILSHASWVHHILRVPPPSASPAVLSALLVIYIQSYTLAVGSWNIPSFFLLWGICVCLYIVVGCTLCPQLIPAGSCSSSRRLFPDHHIPRKWSSVLCLFPLSLFLVLFVAFLTSCNHLIFLVYFLSLLLNSSSIRTWIIFTATSLALRRMPDA